jgi:hypothetical protein
MVFGRVKFAAVDRAHDPQLLALRLEIRPFERQLLRADAGHGAKPNGRRRSQLPDQKGEEMISSAKSAPRRARRAEPFTF